MLTKKRAMFNLIKFKLCLNQNKHYGQHVNHGRLHRNHSANIMTKLITKI
jgi:hypothetical protein